MADGAAQDENALVERVFLRIGSAETDEQLEAALGKFLTPLLLKLNSQDDAVRSKVLKLLAHIKTRLNSRNQIKLPLDALLTQFQDPQASPFITNFTILYIKQGFQREDGKKQADLVPLLLNCLEGRTSNHQDCLLHLFISSLHHVTMPKTTAECQARFPLKDKPGVRAAVLDYCMDVLLLPYSSHVPAAEGAAAPAPPPGLSPAGFKRLTSESPLQPEELERAKLSIINFLGSGILEEEDVSTHFVVASSDTRHSVATSADMELKKIIGSVEWNKKEILNRLFTIFQGTVVLKGKPAPKLEDRRSPVNTRIRLKIFPLFLRAREAGNMFPACLQIVFDCLFGATPNPKLRIMAVEFVHHICLNCEDATFKSFDVVLLTGMVKLIKESKEDPKLRGLAYVAVGKIGRRSPHRLTKDITVVQTFFDALCQEEGDTRMAVQESLSMMSDVFKTIDHTNKQLMEALLLQNIDKTEPQARAIAARYAASVFPADHIPSRYVLLIGAGDIKEDVRTESVKALRGTKPDDVYSKPKDLETLPSFEEMIEYIGQKASQRKQSNNRFVSGNTTLAFNPISSTEMILFLRNCLAQAAGIKVTWLTEDLVDQVPQLRPFVLQLMTKAGTSGGAGPVQQYVAMIQELLSVSASGSAMYCLLEMVAIAPDLLAPRMVGQLDWLKTLLSSSKEDIKQYAAELYSVVAHHALTEAQYIDTVDKFIKLTNDKNPELALGALLTLGYLNGVRINKSSDPSMDSSQDASNEKVLTSCIKTLVTILSENSSSRKNYACLALSEIGRSGALRLPDGELKEGEGEDGDNDKKVGGSDPSSADPAPAVAKKPKADTDAVKVDVDHMTKLALVERLIAMIKTSNEANKTKERAALCLGDICVGDGKFPHRRKAMEDMFNAIQSKQVELQFTIGEALVNMALGPRAARARCVWTTTKEDHEKQSSSLTDDLGWYLDQLLTKYICHSNPHLRQGACVWLLTLTREAGHHPAVQSQLLGIQAGFMRMLGESDDVTQDMASKGLGQVMEVCTPEVKDSLVSDLVETLMTGKRAKNEVTSSTTVFQNGALGKSPDGGSISTYKELCAIATDLNQPDLVYKFMHLANHNATWNARKGAAFGFSTIAAAAGEQLAPHMHQIVPRLYRYRFDPNPKIQQAMSSIWGVLVTDNKKTVDTYLKEILADLMGNLTSNQWRIRESSCMAVSDLLRGRVLDDIIEDLPQLWETCLRVRDDIKESVRLAADSACRTLSKVSVKICDVGAGAVGERAIKTVLPCLLHCSLQSSVSEVRAIGLGTILQISRQAGPLIKPSIAVLVPALLEAVSGLENQVVNYVSLHLSSQANQDRLDNARVAASKSSPMMETVTRCVQYVDDSVLAELVPRLVELIRGGIGVATKAGCSSFIVQTVHQCPRDVTPYAGKLMSALLHGLSDPNATIRKQYATAMGHLVKVGKDSSVEKLITKLRSWYLDNVDPRSRAACCVTIAAISKHSADNLQRHCDVVMPLAFFAMHEDKGQGEDESKDIKEQVQEWEDVWNDITPGNEAGIRLHLTEIVALLASCVDSQAWSTKAQAARAMATVATTLQAKLCGQHLTDLLAALTSGLGGRTWKGKDTLLSALSDVCLNCKEEISKSEKTSPQSIDEIVSVFLREASKDQPAYKMAAMKGLGPVLELYQVDRFTQVWDITQPVLNVNNSNSGRDKEDDRDGSTREALTQAGFTLIGQAFPEDRITQDLFAPRVVQLLCEAVGTSTWKVQLEVLKATGKVMGRLHIFKKEEIQSNTEEVTKLCNQCLDSALINTGNTRYVSLRSESLSVIELLFKRLSESSQLALLSPALTQRSTEELAAIADSGPWELRDRAKAVVDLGAGHVAMDIPRDVAMDQGT